MKKFILLIVLLLVCGVANATDYCATAVGCWLFKEGSGTTVDDSSPNSYTGNFKGSGEPAWESISGTGYPAYSTYSARFDGANDYIDVTDNAVFSSSSFSVAAWIRVDTINTTNGVRTWFITKGGGEGGSYEWALYALSNGSVANFRVTIWNTDTDDWAFKTGTTSISTDTWYHAVLVFNAATQRLFIYVNGTSEGDAAPGGSTRQGDTTSNVSFGARGDNAASFLDGSMTEVAYFSSALSSTEINDIMDNGLSPSAPSGVPMATSWLISGMSISGADFK